MDSRSSAPPPLHLLQRRVRTPAPAPALPLRPGAWWQRWLSWGAHKSP